MEHLSLMDMNHEVVGIDQHMEATWGSIIRNCRWFNVAICVIHGIGQIANNAIYIYITIYIHVCVRVRQYVD